MVEFVVAAMFLLVPMFLAISAIGKFIDVQNTTDMAARYAAWERTIWYGTTTSDSNKFNVLNGPNAKSDNEIRNEIAVRLINDRSSSATVIKNTDKTATSFANGLNPMWHDPSGTNYLTNYTQLAPTIKMEKPAKDIAGAVLGAIGAVPGVGAVVPPVPTDSLAVANVKLNAVAGTSGAYQRLWALTAWAGLDFESTGAVLSNTWSANSASGTRSMVAVSVPTASGGLLNVPLTAAQVAIGTWDTIAALEIDIGRIAVDQVPPDRLK